MARTDASRTRELKLARLETGAKPRVLELASGAGGLALGMQSSGMELTAHIEIDDLAAATYSRNFRRYRHTSDTWSMPRDMTKISAAELVRDLGLGVSAEDAFDILAAGLPCQAFARIGRSKLREVTGDDDAFRNDERAGLYRRFLEYVEATVPLVVMIENVPDILNFGGHNVPEEICQTLERMGYRSAYTILNAAHYGVPQIRERLFLIAYAEEIALTPRFPTPTRHLDLPKGYEGSRKVALKFVPDESIRFQPIHEPSRDLMAAVATREALSDLPKMREHASSPDEMRRRRLDDRRPYSRGRPTAYQSLMRTWPDFNEPGGCSGHVVRLNPRDYLTFQHMPHAADYPVALAVAKLRFREALREAKHAGRSLEMATIREIRRSTVPPYDPRKFPNKWWKLHPDRPSRTLTAHIGKDTYSHIHYDSDQARTISVREAARLQSFPDGFEFAGSMNTAFRQIGNAVPPLLAFAVATEIKAQLAEATASVGRAHVA